MATLGAMKARILAETTRDDLVDEIADEITSAIKFYQGKRFWFNEKRTQITFSTVPGRVDYDGTDQADIPNLVRIDYVTVDQDGRKLPVRYAEPDRIEVWLGSSSMVRNPPVYHSYYGQTIRFYPVPDKAYPVIIAGVVRVGAPASDDEANNPWMTEAEELVRFRAKRNLYLNCFFGSEMQTAASFAAAEEEALKRLKAETSSRTQVDRLRPSCV